jgi:hypothetical protein
MTLTSLTFKNELVFVTSKKFGNLFKDYSKLVLSKKGFAIKNNKHCSFSLNKTRISIKSARAIKKIQSKDYLSNLFHSKELCSYKKDVFDIIIQQIQVDNFDKLLFFVCFDEGVFSYSLSVKQLFKYKKILNYSGKQHGLTKEGLEGQLHITNRNFYKINEIFKPTFISYSSILKEIKNK